MSTPGSDEQVEGRAAAPVPVHIQAMAPGLAGRQGERAECHRRFLESGGLGFVGNSSCSANAADPQTFGRQALVGVVGAQAQPVLGARGEHAVRLGDAARDQVVDHDAEIAVGARDDERSRRPPASRAALMPATKPWAAASS